jgi:hypothetical protein
MDGWLGGRGFLLCVLRFLSEIPDFYIIGREGI